MRVCFTLLVGGGNSKNMFEASLPRLWEKKGTFLNTQKESACQISADSEQLEKLQRNRYICLSSTEPFNCRKTLCFLAVHVACMKMGLSFGPT